MVLLFHSFTLLYLLLLVVANAKVDHNMIFKTGLKLWLNLVLVSIELGNFLCHKIFV